MMILNLGPQILHHHQHFRVLRDILMYQIRISANDGILFWLLVNILWKRLYRNSFVAPSFHWQEDTAWIKCSPERPFPGTGLRTQFMSVARLYMEISMLKSLQTIRISLVYIPWAQRRKLVIHWDYSVRSLECQSASPLMDRKSKLISIHNSW